jgi:hypothetical protein
MAFPLPLDPDFRKAVILSWIEDVYDRLEMGMIEDAEASWKTANYLYLKLPAGFGDFSIEGKLADSRVKLIEHIESKKHANNL